MRRLLLFAALFVFLLAAPIGFRYLRYHGLGAPEVDEPPTYTVAELPPVATPVSNPFVDEPDVGDGFVLLDQAHANDFDLAELGYLDGRLAARGFEMLSFTGGDLASALRPANAFVVIAPLDPFEPDEVRAVADFVDRGGRLFLVGDPTRFDVIVEETDVSFNFSIDSDDLPLNSLANEFGITFNGDYLYDTTEGSEANFRNIVLSDTSIAGNALGEGLERLVFYGSHSLRIGPDVVPLLEAGENTFSSATQRSGDLVMAALSAGERVLSVGDIDFLGDPYQAVYDNSQFVARIADFLVESGRGFVLGDFPYFYGNAVNLVYTGAPELGPDAFDEIISLQEAFRQADRSLALAAEAEAGEDTLYLGLYNQAEEVEELLEGAGISLVIDPPVQEDGEEDGERNIELTPPALRDEEMLRQIQSPLGTVQMAGTALVLLNEEAARRDVVVLAASNDGLERTVERILDIIPQDADSAFADCLLEEALALCPTNLSGERVEAQLVTSGQPDAEPDDEEDEGPDGEGDAEEEGELLSELDAELQGTIGLGETVEDVLDAEQSHAWRFDEGPVTVDIVLDGEDDIDGVLELYDPEFDLVDSADGSFAGGEERLEGVEIEDGTYTIVVRDFFADGGGYSLAVSEAGTEADEEDDEEGFNSIFIFSDDDGIPTAEGETGADAIAGLIPDSYSATVWVASVDGSLEGDTLSDYDLVIWASGDFRTEESDLDNDTLIVLDYFLAGGRLLIMGATPPFLDTDESQVANLVDLEVAANDPILAEGFADGEVIVLEQSYLTTDIAAADIDDDENSDSLFLRGPDSELPGSVSAVFFEDPDTSAQLYLMAVPFLALPSAVQETLTTNLLNWFDR